MRTIVALTLRCWIDDDFPERLCGVLQTAEGKEKYAFCDANDLVIQIRKATQGHPPAQNPPEDPLTQEESIT